MTTSRLWVTLLFASAAFAADFRATVAPGGVTLQASDGSTLSTVELGPVHDLLLYRGALYAALQEGGVAVVNVNDPKAPVVVGRIAQGRQISQLMLSEGRLLLVETRHELSSYDLSQPLQPVATRLGPAAAVDAPVAVATSPERGPTVPPAVGTGKTARVVEVLQGRVIIDAGAEEGFLPGRRVKVVSQRQVPKPDLVAGGIKMQPSNEVTAVLTLEHSEAHRAMTPLGRGDIAEPGDVAVLTEEPISERTFLPRRAPFTLRTGFHLRPFLGMGTQSKPVGFLADFYGGYYFEHIPAQVEVAVAPLGRTFGASNTHYPSSAAITGAYTTDFFEIGLGLGALVGNAGPCDVFREPQCEENTGLTINQLLRLGALDGLSLTWRSSIFSRPKEFVFGSGRGELNLPITSRLGLFGAGGAGENGYAFGEFGVRTYVGGTGARGTSILSASLGYAAIFDGPAGENVGGPSVAFGWEWRL